MTVHRRYRILTAVASLAVLVFACHVPAARADDDVPDSFSDHADSSAFDTLDDTDRDFREAAFKAALLAPLDARRHWSNIESGHDGTFRPTGDKRDDQGRMCRTMEETLRDGGQIARGLTVACRGEANHWQIVRSSMDAFTSVPADLAPGNGMQSTSDVPPIATGPGQVPIQVWIDGENYHRGFSKQSGGSKSP